MKLKRFISAIVAAVLLCGTFISVRADSKTNINSVVLTAENASQASDKTDDYMNCNAVLIDENSSVKWKFSTVEEIVGQIKLVYCPLNDSGADIEIQLYIDDRPLQENRESIKLNRLWREKRDFKGKRFELDNIGNEITPRFEQEYIYNEYIITNQEGSEAPLTVNLSAGKHTLEIKALRQAVAIEKIVIAPKAEIAPYKQKLENWIENGANDLTIGESVVFEAELADLRSSNSIYPTYDRSSPDVSPNSPERIVLNTIGGERWSTAGQWISWKFKVPKSGFYTINFKYRQNTMRGLFTSRKIEIDGTVPFSEFESVGFKYGNSWQNFSPADKDGNAFKIYLSKGEHTLKMTAVLGVMNSTTKNLESIITKLNNQYRYIVMVTGTQPDSYRDYYLEKELPELIPSFKDIKKALEAEMDNLTVLCGESGNQAEFINEIVRQLDDFIEDSSTIPERLSRFKGNIGSLAELVSELKHQPLELDEISFCGSLDEVKNKKSSFLNKIVFRLRAFLSSFSQDYSALGNSYDNNVNPLEVWISASDMLTTGVASGRDQAQTIKRMIDDGFTAQTGIPVNLSLVNTSDVLTRAIMGGKGPDISLFVPEANPINLAMRGALVDFSQMDGFEEIKKQIHPAAFIAYTYENGIYALPETQVWPMMFVRTDVFEELSIEVPDTWKELYSVISKLQKKNLQIGIPESQTIFEMLLMQNGGSLYNNELTKTALTTPQAQTAFKEWTDLYLQYDLDVALNFFNRFRTGEMPLGIADFTMYNQLAVAAPEILGNWQMAPVPGIETDGKTVRTESCGGSACIMLSSSENKENGWNFLRWWLNTETQSEFSVQNEAVLGAAARYNSANNIVFENLPWSRQELEVLRIQRENVSDIPLTPANYYLSRNLTNAFRKVVYQYKNPNETLDNYAKDIDAELERKLDELKNMN